ncbi:hypothetical protein [Paenibacillus sp. SYP-B4298]|uniref:hypothetical protein n=1 Tax=Paenibacillus sp. SYP-B4298 TaxID=2996034 RepID=UPI0022DCE99A|nr:hypothetical protein [Paenibacillus sp. SYP-B4298]
MVKLKEEARINITLDRQLLHTLSDERLSWVCAEPALLQMKARDMETKRAVLDGLEPEQRALCMFWVYYGHAVKSRLEFYSWTSYLMEEPGYWEGVRGSLSFYGDEDMLAILQQTRHLLEDRRERASDPGSAWLSELGDDSVPDEAAEALYKRWLGVAPLSLRRIADHIRANSSIYAEFA